MFSKVFKVEKKNRELQNQPRPSSTNEQRPAYYPLQQSSLHGHRKRATVHDTRASSIEQDLDLLELVCRSDSLHKRLDELQAKYERMEDGMEHISRETHVKDPKSEKRGRQKSGLFSSTRVSKSFEEPEVKKPSFFKRIFGNRLSKSEDDLLDSGGPESSSDVKENGKRDPYRENGTPIATPPLKERRSASADILSIKDLIVRPPDKRHSCSVEFADLRDSRGDMVDCLMPPPPPPPPDLDFHCGGGAKGGLKRKRVIRVYNLNPLDQQGAPTMGSSESCYDSTDSELDVRTRRASESYHMPLNHIYAPPPSHAGETQHCRQHSMHQHPMQQQQHQHQHHSPLQHQQQHHSPLQHPSSLEGIGGGDASTYGQFDLLNGSGRSSRSSYRQQPNPHGGGNLTPGKLTPEGEWPVNEVGSMLGDNNEVGEWHGGGRDGGGMIRGEGKWPIIDGGGRTTTTTTTTTPTMMREGGEWRAKADSWSAGEGGRTSRESFFASREGLDLSPRDGGGGGGGTIVTREESLRRYDSHQVYTPRHTPRSVDLKSGGGGGGGVGSGPPTPHIEARPDLSKRSGGIYSDEAIHTRDSWDSSPSEGELTKEGTVRRRYSNTTANAKKKTGLTTPTDALPSSSSSPVGSQKRTPSPKSAGTPMDTSDPEKQQTEGSDFGENSEADLTPLSKASSSQDLPARLPTTASIQELDHFLSAIIHNLEAQLQAGGSISIKPRLCDPAGGAAAGGDGMKRKRKKRKEESTDSRGQDVIPLRTKKMSECGACGRRWVEPRLLPCLHTVCTPCLHARAAHIPNPSAPPTPAYTQTTPNAFPSPPQPYDGKITTPTHTQSSSPMHCDRPPSQERVLLPPVPLTPTVIPPTPSHSPSTPSPNHPSPTSPLGDDDAHVGAVTTPSVGSVAQHWNGDPTAHHPGTAATSSSPSSPSSGNQTPQHDHYHHYHQHHLQQQQQQHHHHHHHQHHHHHHQKQHLPSESQQQQQQQQHNAQLAAASSDLDSVIELLTNLSPGVSQNTTTNTPSPRLPVTPSPSPAHTPTDAPASLENDLASPSSTLDSRCSSKTRSSRRSSSSESANRNKGIWVVWCHECGFEARVPSGGVECFPLNYILQKQLVLEALNSSSTTVFCDLCQDDVVAEERCDTCPVNLCRLCSRAHTRQRKTNHHNVISLQEARTLGIREVAHTLVCATHGEGEVGWWCRGCQEPLCASCLATLHRGHPTVTVDQEAPHARSSLTSMLDLSSTRMGELLCTVEDLTGAAARVQQRGRAVSDQVNAFIDDYIMALEEHRHTLLRQIRQACERAQRGIITESQRAGQTASWLRQGCDLTHDLLHHAGDAEALALAPVVTLRLQHLLNEDVRGSTRWERLTLLRDHRAGKVRGHRLHGVIADTPAHPPSSRLKLLGDASNLIAGSRVSALVVVRDNDGQPITHGGEDVSATVLTKDGNILCSCSVRDREDGSYEVTFSPPVPSTATLKVTIQGAHVQESPLEVMVTSPTPGQSSVPTAAGGDSSTKERGSAAVPGRQHTGIFHCCTFCSSSGDKSATCACGATMPGGYLGCGHNHTGHPGKKHWSCCAQTSPTAPCTRPPSQYYQVTL